MLGWIFLLILYNLKARKTGCSLLHISHLCKRNGKLYHAFRSHFVQVTVTGTQCGGQQRTGQKTFILNFLAITSSLDLFLTHALIPHAVSPDTMTNVCRDTLNFTRVYAVDPFDSCMLSAPPHFLPFLGSAVTPTATNGCNLEHFHVLL